MTSIDDQTRAFVARPEQPTLRRIDAVLRAGEDVTRAALPPPTAPAIAQEQANQIVGGITSGMLAELRGLRDQIDALTKDATDRRDLIVEAIRSHSEFSQAAIAQKVIIADAMARLRDEFEKSRTPLPPVRRV